MPVTIRPLHPVFAGEVAGVDCRRPLDRETVAAIEAGMDEYAVLVFRDQQLADDEQIAFTRHFGELEHNSRAGHVRKPEDHRLGPGIADFSTGIASPVSAASFKNRSLAASTRRSAGIMSPAESLTTSPGTSSSIGISTA